LVKKIALALGMAAVVGLAAQIRAPLPWTPVPITGQTFAVLLAGILLGRGWGGLSMVIYAGLGAAGLPWFAPAAGMPIFSAGGITHIAGPTGGYIIGFILAALFVGHFTDKYIRARSFFGILGIMLFAGFVLVYIPGLLQLYLWLNLVSGQTASLYQVLTWGFFPFIAGDIIKAILVTGIAWGVTPKQAYNGEVDRDTR
jgi:biotin transport system substrate-specific component